MKSKQLFKIIIFCAGLLALPVTSFAKEQSIRVRQSVISEKKDYDPTDPIFRGLPMEAFRELQTYDTEKIVEHTMPDGRFASGKYSYQLLEKTQLNLVADLPNHEDQIRIHGMMTSYTTLSMLVPALPSQALDFLQNYHFTLKIDPDAEDTCSCSLKKRQILLRQETPALYQIIGLLYGRITNLANTKVWKHACQEEMAAAECASYESFFSQMFFRYCADPKQLSNDYPDSFEFLNQHFEKP